MDNCPRCGEALGPAAGRYCINCGQRIDGAVPTPGHPVAEAADHGYVDWRTDTSERPVVAEPVQVLPVPAVSTDPPDVVPPRDPERPHRAEGPARGAPSWAWVLVGVGMLLVGLVGAWLFFGASGADDAAPVATQKHGGRASKAPSAPVRPEPSKSSKPSKAAAPAQGKPVDLTRRADASAPETAPPSTDASGRKVTYVATQMLDGVPETCWRMPGDGTGSTLVFTLPRAAKITEVGVINGYAKTAVGPKGGAVDWYHGNRRILRAVWTFDDGTQVTQDLADTTSMQTLEIDGVQTTTVKLTLADVSSPGTGRAARNYTAISDVSLLGALG
jgi:hypothetical protein